MTVTIPFWDFVKLEAARLGLSENGAWYRIKRSGKKVFGGHHQKKIQVNLPREQVVNLRAAAILARVKYCACGQVSVRMSHGKEPVCLRCWDLEYRRYESEPVPAGLTEFKLHCEIA